MKIFSNSLKLIQENKWHNARNEWIHFTQIKPNNEKNSIVYNFFLNEFDSYYEHCAKVTQHSEFNNICSIINCILSYIADHSNSFRIR